MYFSQFDSYNAAVDKARSFVITVTLITGGIEESSSVPFSGWDGVLADLAEFWSTKSTFAVWNNAVKTVTMVNYDQVRTIKIRWLE